MEDFRKYATKHLGMSGTALDSYMNISSSYISPTIIEERQLNVAQMDVFSRLMMDRIIFLGTQVDDYTANVIPERTSLFISIRRVALYMRATAFTTRCSLSPATYLRFVRVWPPLWRLSYWWREPRENVSA